MLIGTSFRSRLIRWYLISLLAILVVFGITMHAMIRSHLYAQQDAEMDEESREATEALQNSLAEFQKDFDQHFSAHGRFSFQIEKEDDSVVTGSRWLRAHRLPRYDWGDGENPLKIQDVSLGIIGSHRIFSRWVKTSEGTFIVRVVAANSLVEQNMWQFTRIMLLASSLALVTACWGGMMITRQAMRPLEQIIRDAERISAENFNELVTVQNPNDELGRLAITLNTTFSRLRKSIQQMSRFTADAAHELRTPLAALRLECDVALSGEQDLPSLKRSMMLALEEIDRLSKIVNQLLSLSRIDSGVESQNLDSVFLRPLVKDVADLLEKSASVKGVAISVGPIPDRQLQGDDVALSRLFFNLIDNAIKYTPSGGRVSIVGKDLGTRVEIAITDTGIGIDRKDWEQLFDRFYRVDKSRNTKTGGAGLGLAICKAIADAHFAKLSVDSVVGRGSTFTVSFPIVIETDSDAFNDEHANGLQKTTIT